MVSENNIYTGGALKNDRFTFSQENIRLIINATRLYNLKPSFLITQMFVESHWGDRDTSYVGSVDNNWSGISEPFSVPSDLGISMTRGTARPFNEGGYYVHFSTINDFFKAYAFVLSKRNGMYNVEGTNTIEAYTKGLFRIGGARGDYAEVGYDHYLNMMVPTYNAIVAQNPGKLDQIDLKSTPAPVNPPKNSAPATGVNYTPHLAEIGWTKWFSNGTSTGNTTKKVEAIAITVDNLPEKGTIQYRGHVQSLGWQGWVSNGAIAGTTGQSRRLEAIEIKLTEDLEKSYDISCRTYVEGKGWQDWVSNGATSGTIDKALELKDIQIKLIEKPLVKPPVNTSPVKGVNYIPHLSSIGWTKWVSNGSSDGNTTKKVEAIAITVDNLPEKGTIQYRGHVQSRGWQGWVTSGAVAGTTGQSKRLEAVEIKLTEDLEKSYDISYRTYVEGKGWQGWVSNGATSGTIDKALELKDIQIKLIEKPLVKPPVNASPVKGVNYIPHLSGIGWTKWIFNGAGIENKASKQLEAIAITVNGMPYTGGIEYRSHIQSRGWQEWVSNGQVAGTTGQSKRLEAIQMRLTGELAKYYNIEYQAVLGENMGSQEWKLNGEVAGTTGLGYQLTNILVKITKK